MWTKRLNVQIFNPLEFQPVPCKRSLSRPEKWRVFTNPIIFCDAYITAGFSLFHFHDVELPTLPSLSLWRVSSSFPCMPLSTPVTVPPIPEEAPVVSHNGLRAWFVYKMVATSGQSRGGEKRPRNFPICSFIGINLIDISCFTIYLVISLVVWVFMPSLCK